MRIYITTQGAKVIKEGRHLLVRHGENIHRTIFVHKVKQLIVCGNIEVTPAARNVLFRHNVDTVFLTRNGRYVGGHVDLEPRNVFLRKRQFSLADDLSFGISFCRQVISGKLSNMSVVLMRIYRKKNKKHISEKAKQMRKLITGISSAETIESLRGYEGRGSAIYFGIFNSGFDTSQGFTTRVRRPPTDPVNAVLSLLYTFLYNQVYSAVRQSNLDPYVGYLHSLEYGRYSLVLDLMEEFRPVIVDTLTLSLFNLGILNRDKDFHLLEKDEEGVEDQVEASAVEIKPKLPPGQPENELFDTPVQKVAEKFTMPPVSATGRRPVNLQREAMKKVIVQFERKLATSFIYEPEDRKLTYAEAIVRQARQYRKVVEGDVSMYQPLLLR